MSELSRMTKLLEELGSHPDEVAANLQALNIQGVRYAVRFLNPIVRYLQLRLQVNALSVDLMQRNKVRLHYGNGSKEDASLPEPVLSFLDAFNQGAYPELLTPAERASTTLIVGPAAFDR